MTTYRSSCGLALVPLGALLLAACIDARSPGHGENRPSTPVEVFPPQSDLAKLPSLPAPPEAFGVNSVTVDSWSVDATATTQDDEAAYVDTSRWGELTRSMALAHKATTRLSPALQCAAHEIARFRVEKGAVPTESLRRFLVARCGGSSPDAQPVVFGGEAPEKATDAAIYESSKGVFEKAVSKLLGGEAHHTLGVATHRAGRQYAMVAVVGGDEVSLEAGSRTPDESRRVLVRGTLRTPAADAMALINRGDYGAAPCPRDPRAELPRFTFSCRLGDGDHAAWVQILVRRPGRVLDDEVAELLAYEGDASKVEYRPRASGVPAPVSDAAGFTSALLGAINRVRAEGKIAPVTLAIKQSAENARLVGTLIDASVKGKNEVGDGIALGLVAGWDVDGMIRGGQLLVAMVAPTRDVRVWLDFALERPFGRSVLLDPDARRLAIGPTVLGGEGPALGAVVTSYALFDTADHGSEASSMAARVQAERAQLGKPALVKIDSVRALADEARLVLAGEREPSEALDVAMRAVAQKVTGTVHGFYVETNALDHAPIPEELLRAPKGALAVQVTHHRVKGAAWGQYVILYVLVDDAPAGGNFEL